MAEKIFMAVCLFAGFLWLRSRARSLDLAHQQGKTVIGIFGVLTALLIGEKYVFDTWHFGPYTGLALKLGLTVATFAGVGFLFLKPGPPRETPGAGESVPPPA